MESIVITSRILCPVCQCKHLYGFAVDGEELQKRMLYWEKCKNCKRTMRVLVDWPLLYEASIDLLDIYVPNDD